MLRNVKLITLYIVSTYLPLRKTMDVVRISSIPLFISNGMLLFSFSQKSASRGKIREDGVRNLKNGFLFLYINKSDPHATATAKN